ncbi:MAG TPA: hypothetical protein VF631_13075 [Allosphingosinicella sp.]
MRGALNSPSFVYIMFGAPFFALTVRVLVFVACPVEDVVPQLCVTLSDADAYVIPCHTLPMA